MKKTNFEESVLEGPVKEGSYLMGTFAIVLMILLFVSAGFYFVVSNYA